MQADDLYKAQSDRLALLYHLSQTFNSSLDLDEVLNRVMDEVITSTHAERGFVMLREASDGKLVFRAARGLDQTTIEDPQFQISRSVVERVAAEGQPILTSDAQNDARFNIRQSVVFLGLRSILCVPLTLKEKAIGVIYVDNRLQAGIFTQADLELLSAIASSAAIAIENARLYQVAVEKGRMERELQMARKVQASLLPQETPALDGWEFASRWQPAREVGGDYYDFIPVKGRQLGVLIADVTDKGMPAALFMASTRSIMRATMPRAASPAEGITQANRLICAESDEGLFVTMFYLVVNPITGEVTYVNAGHNPPLLSQQTPASEGVQLTRLSFTGNQLGMEQNSTYKQHSIYLKPGDFILLYTDGVTDATNPVEEEFGMLRLQELVISASEKNAEGLLDELEAAIHTFTGPTTPVDDFTLVMVKRK